jgi:hypothetical protein
MPPDAWFFVLAEGTGAQFGMEHYQLLRADGPVPDCVLEDLFTGLAQVAHGLAKWLLKRRPSHARRR